MLREISKFWGTVFPAQDDDELPERVRQAIRQQQDRSEILISWFQLAVVLTFGTLYIISPKTFTEEAAFAPVPWALAVYLALTLIRLAWSRRGHLPQWSLALSVFFDVGLLMVLIWSFHIQYGQPASFYLKAPTLLYVFIFIALRALRFETRFVVFAGLVAALGWGALILYVVYSDPGDTMITRNYVTYLTSNAILLGAEFDKIISILVVTAIIAVAIHRARGLLVRAVAEQTAARELSRFFDSGVARRIARSEESITAGSGEARNAAIVNLDMRGFTALAEERSPDEVMAILADYQSRMVPVLQEHGGSIDKFMGDGIMATFGAAQPSETYAADALRAIEAAMKAAEAWELEAQQAGRSVPCINAAAAHGRVVFGAVGDENRLEYTVIGDAVNLSAKLEKHNKAEKARALVTAELYELALQQGYQAAGAPDRRTARKVAGVAQPLDLVVVTA